MYDAASVCSHVEAELLLPGPVICAGDSGLVELLYHADVVDDVQDQGLQLQLQDSRLCPEVRGTGTVRHLQMAQRGTAGCCYK